MQFPSRGGSNLEPPQTDPPEEPTLEHVPEQPTSILELTSPAQTHPAAAEPQKVTPGRIVVYGAASGPIPAIVTHTPESVSDAFEADRPVHGTVHLVLVSAWLQPYGTNALLNVQQGDGKGEWSWPPRST